MIRFERSSIPIVIEYDIGTKYIDSWNDCLSFYGWWNNLLVYDWDIFKVDCRLF